MLDLTDQCDIIMTARWLIASYHLKPNYFAKLGVNQGRKATGLFILHKKMAGLQKQKTRQKAGFFIG